MWWIYSAIRFSSFTRDVTIVAYWKVPAEDDPESDRKIADAIKKATATMLQYLRDDGLIDLGVKMDMHHFPLPQDLSDILEASMEHIPVDAATRYKYVDGKGSTWHGGKPNG